MADLLSIIPDAEREQVEAALSVLENGAFDEAVRECSEIISGDYSNEAKAFARYGAGVALMRRFVVQERGRPGDVDLAIEHYEACLDELKFGDAYLMLGMALKSKMYLLKEDNDGSPRYYRELLKLAERAAAMFKEAGELNVGFKRHATEEMRSLEPIIAGLLKAKSAARQ